MRKTYQVNGYGTNKRGHTVGICYTLTATSEDKARETAQRLAAAGGYKHVSIRQVSEVRHD
ncbi:hypothetical protein [Enterobacter mori]|uniref:hypothetical protein n=1 Tax=Enterobacter mori TaxID=539813 RepID=UPI003B83CD24